MRPLLLLDIVLDLCLCLCALILLPVLVLILGPLFLWRGTVGVLARLFRAKDLGPMLSPMDATFIPFKSPETRADPEFHVNPDCIVSIVVVLDGIVDIGLVRRNWTERILRGEQGGYERFQQHVSSWLGFAFYKWDPVFEIEEHIRMGPDRVTEVNLDEFVLGRLQAPWRKQRSMWDFVLVPGYNGELKTLGVFRFCHAMGDGLSLVQMLSLRIMDLEIPKLPKPSTCGGRPTKSVPILTRLQNLYMGTLGLPRQFLKEASDMAANGFMCQRVLGSEDDKDRRLISSTDKILLEDIKRLKTQAGISFSEAIHSAISVALSNHVKEELGVKDKKWIPGATIFPGPGHPEDQLVNVFNIAGLAVSLDESSNSFSATLATTRGVFAHASSPPMKVNYVLETLRKALPLALLSRLPPPNITFLYSNFPGPTHRAHFWGHEIRDMMFWLKARKTSPVIMFSIMSYDGEVKIGVTACSSFVKNQEQLDKICGELQDELRYMMTLKKGEIQI